MTRNVAMSGPAGIITAIGVSPIPGVPHLEFALLCARLRDGGRVACGSIGNADLVGHGW